MAPLERADEDRTAAMAALADPVRRALFEQLVRRPASVRRLAEGFPITRAAISQHLKVLKDLGLVDYSRRGALNVYSARCEPLLRLQGYVGELCQRMRDRREPAYELL